MRFAGVLRVGFICRDRFWLVSCLTRILVVEEKNILIQNSLQSYSFATHGSSAKDVSTFRLGPWLEDIANHHNNLLFFLAAPRAQKLKKCLSHFIITGDDMWITPSWLLFCRQFGVICIIRPFVQPWAWGGSRDSGGRSWWNQDLSPLSNGT